jgi:hypothetical protein
MRKRLIFLLIIGIGITGTFMAAKQEPKQNKLYIQATIYPTFSLSRYDYNNDMNHAEIRAYIELRKNSVCGDIIDKATVMVNSEKLDFKENLYEKRINIPWENLAEEVMLKITVPEGITLERTYPIPDWLVIKSPQPSIIESSQPLLISWEFHRCPGPVKVDAYDFRTGDDLLDLDNFKENKIVIPEEKIPKKSLLRILVLHTWFYKQYIRGEQIAVGSEINMMPWSQVFIRTK